LCARWLRTWAAVIERTLAIVRDGLLLAIAAIGLVFLNRH